ncbi:hypothetical protein LAZ67_18002283 [Cordylochernes scorpioides]|uniref:Transposase n=1 Tax=Cordylochernes scorpioides TaxID=51811 RepID=A0ABY6LJ90_9ARAC|nr:hypothetical protein LAZ67_18002283 [Cordylochernes scorpioides]
MEQRAVIKFNAKLGRSASETYILMKQVYGTLCLSKSNVFIWHKRFSDGRNTLEDDKHTGRPSSSKTPESIEKVREFVENNDGRDDLKWRAVGRMEAGQSQVEVAKWLNVNKSVVSKIWKQFIETGTIKRKEGSGRKRKTATSEDRYLVVTVKRHREMTAIQLSNELSSATGTRISRQTVYRRLHEGALYARRPMVCIPLTSAHRRARLNWCLEHHAWTHDQWANVLFSDESRFSLNTDSRRVFIWREPGTRYHPSNIREIDSFRGGSLLVWAGISSSSRTPLHIFSGGTLTAQRYRDEILEPYLRPYRDQIGHNLILMDDNARPHRARLVNEYLQSENIRRMDWPARSLDLNPIEHVWDALGRRFGARHHSPRTLVELRTALLEEWGLLPLDLLQSLVNSMRARCETLELPLVRVLDAPVNSGSIFPIWLMSRSETMLHHGKPFLCTLPRRFVFLESGPKETACLSNVGYIAAFTWDPIHNVLCVPYLHFLLCNCISDYSL